MDGKRPNISLDLANTSYEAPTSIQSARSPAKRPATARPAGPTDAEHNAKLEEEQKKREDFKRQMEEAKKKKAQRERKRREEAKQKAHGERAKKLAEIKRKKQEEKQNKEEKQKKEEIVQKKKEEDNKKREAMWKKKQEAVQKKKSEEQKKKALDNKPVKSVNPYPKSQNTESTPENSQPESKPEPKDKDARQNPSQDEQKKTTEDAAEDGPHIPEPPQAPRPPQPPQVPYNDQHSRFTTLEQIQKELDNLQSYYPENIHELVEFQPSVGSKSALELLNGKSDTELYLDDVPAPDIIWCFRLFFQLMGRQMPEDNEEAWAVAQKFIRTGQSSGATGQNQLSTFIIKEFTENLNLSPENIDIVENMLHQNKDKLAQDSLACKDQLVGFLMFPIKEAIRFSGADIYDKTPPQMKYQRLMHKKAQLEGQGIDKALSQSNSDTPSITNASQQLADEFQTDLQLNQLENPLLDLKQQNLHEVRYCEICYTQCDNQEYSSIWECSHEACIYCIAQFVDSNIEARHTDDFRFKCLICNQGDIVIEKLRQYIRYALVKDLTTESTYSFILKRLSMGNLHIYQQQQLILYANLYKSAYLLLYLPLLPLDSKSDIRRKLLQMCKMQHHFCKQLGLEGQYERFCEEYKVYKRRIDLEDPDFQYT